MSSNEWPFLNGVWRQHDSEYVISKSVLDSYGIDVKEDDVKKEEIGKAIKQFFFK